MGPPTYVQTLVRVSSSPIRFIWRADAKWGQIVPTFEPQFEMTPRRDPRAAPRVPVALAPCATTIRVYRARPRPRAWPECRERVRRPAPRHPLWGRSAPPQRVGPHPSNKTSQLLMSRQSERQRRPPRGWRRGSRSGPRVRAAANVPARNRMRRGAPAFALLRTVVWCIYVWLFEVATLYAVDAAVYGGAWPRRVLHSAVPA